MNRAMMWTVPGAVIVGVCLALISPMIAGRGPSTRLEDRLISYQPMNMPSAEMSIPPAGYSGAEQSGSSLPGVMLAGVPSPAAFNFQQQAPQSQRLQRAPERVIRDNTPSFSAVAVDVKNGEVVAADESLHQILVYDRMANTPPNARLSEPRRMLGGDETGIEFVCGVHVDPQTGDIYATHADTAAVMLVFSRDQRGNVPAMRTLETGSDTRGRGILVDEVHKELFLTSQHNSAVVVWRKEAEGEELPIRLLQGDLTRLANPHGVALDAKNDLIFVTNHGHVSSRSIEGVDPRRVESNRPLDRSMAVRGSGRFNPPSINVFPRDAKGDIPPLRIIQGPRTQLDWPSGIGVDERSGEIYVANDTGQSILVFDHEANGNVEPVRILAGPRTRLDSPVGLFIDKENNELWVSNYGNHSLNVYDLSAKGDVPPKRTIRSGPLGKRALMIGNPGALAYDTKREQILVPN
jgi:DNA-binding beta-propeller fold protein YncE